MSDYGRLGLGKGLKERPDNATDLGASQKRDAAITKRALGDLEGRIEDLEAGTSLTDVWLPASALGLIAGSPTLDNKVTNNWIVWLLDAAAVETVAGSVFVPTGWATVDIELWWTNGGAGAGDVRWECRTDGKGDTETIATGSGSEVTVTAAAENVVKKTQLVTGYAVTAGELLGISLERMATHAADTLANDAAVIGLRVVKAS